MTTKNKTWLMILLIPVAYALFLRIVFGLDIIKDFATVMSIAFLIGVPFGTGYLAVLLSPLEKVRNTTYRILLSMMPIFVFLLVTLAFGIEGWACWIMILPVFLIIAIAGGALAARDKIRRAEKNNRLRISIVLCLPFLLSAAEIQLPHLPARYEAYTYIDIDAGPATIWSQVTRVRAIGPNEDKGTLTNFLGFPRPVRAELDTLAVGGSRLAIFTKGLVFKETVTHYIPQRQMRFTIAANPYDIPSTTMDKHVVIGGDYFDVLDGTYRLEPLTATTCRLHLYSHFELKTTFNFYAGWWARMIMKDIQNNILLVIQTRCRG